MFDDWIKENVENVLLVEPNFPIPAKSRNHKNFLPIGLLKIAAYLKSKSIKTKLIRFESDNQMKIDDKLEKKEENFNPDLICVTSIFTYWSKYVKEAVKFYKNKYPKVPILVGGIYASLLPDHCKEYTGCDEVIFGTIEGAEKVLPDYSLVNVDYQIIHTTRGCIRRCGCCGVYDIEPEWLFKKSIKDEIVKKKIIFYDNNLIANPYIKNILNELIELKKNRKINYIESQSGFDGRILVKDPEIPKLLKESGFKNIKIAWDGSVKEAKLIKKQLNRLIDAGFHAKDISVFMIYNYDLPYTEMEEKRVYCFDWGVQITDCRYRPLDSTFDNYSPHKIKGQSNKDYYIHPKWTDHEIRKFRRNIRRHNICVRRVVDYHSAILERKKVPKKLAAKYQKMEYEEVKNYLPDAWAPKLYHKASEKDYYIKKFKKK